MNSTHKFHLFVSIATLVLLSIIISTPAQARGKKDNPRIVYAFGAAENLTDSLLYLSSIQELKGAELDRNGFLIFNEDYDAQLQQYIQTLQPDRKSLCVTIYSTSRSKLEKKYLRMRRDWNRRTHKRIIELPINDFQFRPRQSDEQ